MIAAQVPIAPEDRLIFALDVPDLETGRNLVRRLGDTVRFYKLGLELFMADIGFVLLDELVGQQRKVFVDVKLFDVPATVARAVNRLADRGATFITVHGNQGMMEAAVAAKGASLKILAVTALTSLDRGDLDDLGFACDAQALVLSRARRALAAGCDGIVSSGLEVPALRQQLDPRLVVVTPGIRPVENRVEDDQKRVVTPLQALRNGADYIVVGRPIRDAADPAQAAAAIQAQIADYCTGTAA